MSRKKLPSSASTQINSTSTKTKAEVSLIPNFPSHPAITLVSMEFKLKTSSRLLQDYFKTIFRLIQFNWASTQLNFKSNSELGTTQLKLVSAITDPILTKHFGPNVLGTFTLFDQQNFGIKIFLTLKSFWTKKSLGQNMCSSIFLSHIFIQNTSLAALGFLAHHLRRRTACNT